MPIKALLFDWGNTLMRDIAGQNGAMAHWPAVEAIPNATDTLAQLSREYPLFIATNAVDSNAELVFKALERVHLENFIQQVFTSSEIGLGKDSPAFYQQIASRLGLEPETLAMIGDDYKQDVLNAQSAGLRIIWFNESGTKAIDSLPYQDGEIFTLTELPALLQQGFQPDIAACDMLYNQYQVPENVRIHMHKTAQFAYNLAVALKKKGIELNPILVQRAAYLHDLDKLMVSMNPSKHGQVSAGVLRESGFLRLAELVEGHVLEKILINPSFYLDWAARLVYYADKRFHGERFVTVAERCQALQSRYPHSAEKIRVALPHILALEAEISSVLQNTLDLYI